jgi:flavin reductase (DIM6/NTAB) family NADH-FMN oxidoreductase RutF
MEIDINALPPAEQYKLLSSTVVPRPIALVTTISDQFGDNAAPYSFFNCMGENPPVMVLSLETKRHNQALKDTTVNIRDNGQFVIHLVDEPMAEAMNICAIDFPSNISEVEQAGLTLTASRLVRPKRIVEAPIAFECEKIALIQIGPTRNIAIGKVVRMHVRDGLLDPVTNYINPELYRPVGRMFGKLYTRTRDHFEMVVPSFEDWEREHMK